MHPPTDHDRLVRHGRHPRVGHKLLADPRGLRVGLRQLLDGAELDLRAARGVDGAAVGEGKLGAGGPGGEVGRDVVVGQEGEEGGLWGLAVGEELLAEMEGLAAAAGEVLRGGVELRFEGEEGRSGVELERAGGCQPAVGVWCMDTGVQGQWRQACLRIFLSGMQREWLQ